MDEENLVKDYFGNNWESTHNADGARAKKTSQKHEFFRAQLIFPLDVIITTYLEMLIAQYIFSKYRLRL